MKKILRLLSVACLTAACIALLGIGASAAEAAFYAAGTDAAKNSTVTAIADLPSDAISWQRADGLNYTLFLPATADLSDLRLWFGVKSVKINDQVVYSGEKTDIISAPGTYYVTFGSRTYTLKVMQSANIGSMFITTQTGTLNHIIASKDHSVAETGTMLLVDQDGNVAYNDNLDQVKGRGNTTWQYAKRPFQIKLSNKTNLFGMGKAKTWILLANYLDRSLLRNALTIDLARNIGFSNTVQYKQVDFYANHLYQGSYQLCEKVEVGSNRVDITDLEKATEALNPNDLSTYSRGGSYTSNTANTSKWYNIPNNPKDITGGYLLEFEMTHRYPNEPSGFVTKRGICIVVKEPEYASKEQIDYISSYVQDVEDAIFSDSGYNSKGKHYSDYIDVDEFALRYLLEELVLNPDAMNSSFYMYKDSDQVGDGKFHCDQIWDYDLSYGNYILNYDTFANTSYWYLCGRRWYAALCKDEAFIQKIQELYASTVRPVAMEALDGLAARETLLTPSANMNFKLWNINDIIPGTVDIDEDNDEYVDDTTPALYSEPIATKMVASDTGKDFTENVAYVKNFILKRIALFDEEGFQQVYFSDVSFSDWFYSDVKYAYRNDIMHGVSESAFAPNTVLSRAMAVMILANLSGEDISPYTSDTFVDVDQKAWYAQAVAWAEENNITTGTSSDRFSPESPVTREQMVALLYRYCKYMGIDTSKTTPLTPYTDASRVSNFAKEPMAWAVACGYITGMTPTTLAPQNTATRAQAAAIFTRAHKSIY